MVFLGEAYFVSHFFYFFYTKYIQVILFICIFERSTGHNELITFKKHTS